MPVNELKAWSPASAVAPFPYDAVVDAYRRVGKHFVPADLTRTLGEVRDALGDPSPADFDRILLRDFLDCALDKARGAYDYRSYLGLVLLPMCSLEDPPDIVRFSRARRDRLVAHLIADLFSFELAAADGRSDVLPEMRPDPRRVEKRYRVGLRFVGPILDRLGVGRVEAGGDHEHAAHRLISMVDPDLSCLDRRILRLSMLPVHVCHDEYLFIRVLQLFEATFGLLTVQLGAAVQSAVDGDCKRAAGHVGVAEEALRESAPLLSLLGTMQREAFQTFRAYTEGASAIQSRNYKIVEALCRRPDERRLHSAAFSSVPEVQQRVLGGNTSLDDALHAARRSGSCSLGDLDVLEAEMERFAVVLLRWRQSHYRLAVTMLGTRTGTGYTEGTPYLEAGQRIPVFCNVNAAETTVPIDAG